MQANAHAPQGSSWETPTPPVGAQESASPLAQPSIDEGGAAGQFPGHGSDAAVGQVGAPAQCVAPGAAYPQGHHGASQTPFFAPPTSGPSPASGPSLAAAPSLDSAGAQPSSIPPSGSPFPAVPLSAPPHMAAPQANAHRGRKARSGPGWVSLAAAMVLTCGLSVGGTAVVLNATGDRASTASENSTQTQNVTQTVPPVATTSEGADWEAVAAAVSPAVVTIQVEASSGSGVGSGVIYNSQGDIVTNYHVISAALNASGRISVTLDDGRIYEAEVVGHDQSTDLAVIRLANAPSDLTVASFGSSANLVVGQEVMAIGSPLGLSNTVTTGVISALDRPVEVSTEESTPDSSDPSDPFGQLQQEQSTASESVITNAIQVDASINPGNSGGPLFDASGAVIGINSSIASMGTSSSESSGSIGLGFAIPSDLVVSVVDQLIESGTVAHAVLGVTITTGSVTVDGATRAGAQIAGINPGGAAEAAGLEVGDTIIAVDGNEVASSRALSGFIRRYTSGDQVTITYVRDGVQHEVSATLQATD